MKTEHRTRRRRLPLFVLPTVLLPGARLPLHVFEGRYRQMVARCLEYDRRFGLLFHREDLHGRFRIEADRVGCVAEIASFSPLPDGRSLMVTEGIERFRIVDGVESETLYHEALVEEYGDEEGEDDVELILRRQRSVELFKTLLRSVTEPTSGLPKFDSREDVSFEIASVIEIDPAWHQSLLELRSARARLDQIDQLLRVVLETRMSDETGSEADEER
jgi:ATP-dependent Lon protease